MAKTKRSEWDKRIARANKFFSNAREHGRKVYLRYKDDRADDLTLLNVKRANFFYSNVNTIKESLFNSLPKPDVRRLHISDYEDDVARVAALIVSRGIDYELNCCKDFKGAVRAAILDRLVPGIGQVWLSFETKKDDAGAVVTNSETMTIESVYWEDFIYEPARSWDKVTWAGRRLELTKKEAEARWGKEKVLLMDAAKNNGSSLSPKELAEDKYEVYEIWDKTAKKVVFVSTGLSEVLEERDDPYKLTDFYPFPQPLVANLNTTAFLPVTDYHIAQDQYIQLDILYARMSLIVDAIRVAGAYDSSATEIKNMLSGEENKLIPVDNWAMYAEKGGAKGLIDWYPVEQVVAVLEQLRAQFEAIKGLLFEISGMADIVRGDTNQYETAKAQEIKSDFASVRMNGYQRDVSEFVTGILKIMAELMCQLYSDEKLVEIIGPLNSADQPLVPAAAQVIRNSFTMHYKVSIQANSLTQADWAREKSQKMELMGYLSQFLTSAVGAIQQTPTLAPLLIGLMKFSITGFKGSSEIEGLIDQQMDALQKAQEEAKKNPQPAPPSPEQIKAQAEQMRIQADVQKMQMQAQIDKAQAEQSAALEQQRSQFDMQIETRKLEQQAALAEKEAQLKAQLEMQKAQLEAEMMRQRMAHESAMQEQKLAYMRAEQELKLQIAHANAQLKIDADAISKTQDLDHKEQMNELESNEGAE